MRYQRLGPSGPLVSVLGLGASHFGRVCDLEQTRAVVHAALDSGVTFIDTAEAYAGSEDLLGRVLDNRRRDVVLSSKFGHPWSHPEGRGGGREVIRKSIEGTLKRLRTDYLDVYVMHVEDPETPIEETLEALDELVRSGLVRFVGTSNFAAWRVVEAAWTARTRQLTPFVCVQHRYSLLEREVERDVVPVCERYDLGLVAAVPLASGLLSGRYRRGEPIPPDSRAARAQSSPTDATFDRLEHLQDLAQQFGITLLELAIGGLAAHPCVGTVITGATRPEQIRANARAAEWQPRPQELELLRS
jgi:aryl-alcohol dehydrogenase-like predicted oxidoreductase